MPASPPAPDSYESLRARNIARNRALLASLDLPTTSPPRKRRKPAPSNPPAKPTPSTTSTPRTSARLANRPPPTTPPDLEPLDRTLRPGPRRIPPPLPPPGPALSESPFHAAPPALTPTGAFAFPDFPTFTPNVSPARMLHAGVHGGTLYAPHESRVLRRPLADDWRDDLPPEWLAGLDVERKVAAGSYDEGVNRWRVKAGQSLGEWERQGWVWPGDPRGWGQWYVRFWRGRRVAGEDERQVGRWERCVGAKGRWRRRLEKEVDGRRERGGEMGRGERVVRQICLQWGWEMEE